MLLKSRFAEQNNANSSYSNFAAIKITFSFLLFALPVIMLMMIMITWSVLRAYILLGSLIFRSLITIRSVRHFWVPTFSCYTIKPWTIFYYGLLSSRLVESCHLVFYQLSSWKLQLSFRYPEVSFSCCSCSTGVHLRKNNHKRKYFWHD